MSPWDELQYFDLPVVQVFTSSTDNKTPIAVADPQRVYLLFATGSGGGTVVIAPLPGVGIAGIGLSPNSVPVVFRARDDPVLTQGAWYAAIGVGPSLTVIQVRLREWPRSNAVQRVGAPLPWERLVRPQWPGGVGNGKNPGP